MASCFPTTGLDAPEGIGIGGLRRGLRDHCRSRRHGKWPECLKWI